MKKLGGGKKVRTVRSVILADGEINQTDIIYLILIISWFLLLSAMRTPNNDHLFP